MKNIIIPIDFSDESLKALEFAAVLSKKMSVNIQMVYVQKNTTDGMFPTRIEDEHSLAENKFNKIIDGIKSKLLNDSKIRFIIKKGRIYQEIASQSQSYNESMIIMSTHGASGFEELFLGSNAIKIMNNTDRPVITLRKNDIPQEIKKIVLPLDILLDSRQKVPFTADLASSLGAEILVTPVSPSSSKRNVNKLQVYTKQVLNYLEQRQVPYTTKYLFGDDGADLIINCAIKENADIITIITEGSASFGLNTFIKGPYSQLMVNKSPIPVLSYKPKEIFIKGSFNTHG